MLNKKTDWTEQREWDGIATLREVGVDSFLDLIDCILIVHISYELKEPGGISFAIRPQQVEFEKGYLKFSFDRSPIEVWIDIVGEGKPLGDLEDCDTCNPLLIRNISYKQGGWVAFYEGDSEENPNCGDIFESLSVKILTKKQH